MASLGTVWMEMREVGWAVEGVKVLVYFAGEVRRVRRVVQVWLWGRVSY